MLVTGYNCFDGFGDMLFVVYKFITGSICLVNRIGAYVGNRI